MNVQSLQFYQLQIPFKVAFKHSSASRMTTESIWVEARLENGLTGFGESCPRAYVTGETLETASNFLNAIRERVIQEVHTIEDLKRWVATEKDGIDHHPAAWCALELALLDLLGKSGDRSVEDLLGLPALRDTFSYTAVLGDSAIDVFRAQLEQYGSLGFRDYKVKVSGNLAQDRDKLACFTKRTDPVHVRLDANNLWHDPGEAIRYVQSLDFPVWAIEEPLAAGDFKGLSEMARQLGIKIILDESFLRAEDFRYLQEAPDAWIINLRISKMGGLIRSIGIVDVANRLGIDLIIGAQVGETSLLTRAALSIANYAGQRLLAQEGAFGTLLLTNDMVTPQLMFGEAGKLELHQFKFAQKAGFGLLLDATVNSGELKTRLD